MRIHAIPRVAGIFILVSLIFSSTAAAFAAGPGVNAPAATTRTFAATADAYVIQSSASSNYGSSQTLRADASPDTRSYVRFVVSGLNGAKVASAKVRLYANSANSTGVTIKSLADNSWVESQITYSNAPAPGGSIGTSKAISSSTWVDVDVSSYVAGDGTYNMVVTTTSATNTNLCSKETSGKGPQLVLTMASGSTATPTRPASPAKTPTQNPPPSPTVTTAPINTPTSQPTATNAPTQMPTTAPTQTATDVPTQMPTTAPTQTPTSAPTQMPTSVPTQTATSVPTQAATATSQSGWQPSFPIRAAFYYPWFPQAWTQLGIYPYTNYTPSLGFYSNTDQAILKQHIAMMQYGNIQAGIASWWGQGSQTDTKIPGLLSAAAGTNFRWALYYELESQGDPSASQIQNDLTYIRDHYAKDPSFLRVNGKFVVFVYAAGNDVCGMADRWKQGNTVGAYVVLKVFAGFRNCASQPDSWHQYSPAVAADQQNTYSYAISPGFWLKGNAVRLVRDIVRWQGNVRDMVASGANWQLVTTFSEWGEGTSVEPAVEWASPSGFGLYLDALHYNGNMP